MNVSRILVVLVGAALLGGGGSAAAPEAGQAEQPCRATTQVTCQLPRATVGKEYRHQLDLAPFTLACIVAYERRPLPGCLADNVVFTPRGDVGRWAPGLSVSPSGLISGTPTQAGRWVIGLAAFGSDPDRADHGVGLALEVDLAIRPRTLPVAHVDKRYRVKLEVLGEEPPFFFRIADRSCPFWDGPEIDRKTGVISGTPRRARPCRLKLAVEKHFPRASFTTEKQFELTVKGEEEDEEDTFSIDLKGPIAITLDVERTSSGDLGIRKLERATYRATVRNLTPLPQSTTVYFSFNERRHRANPALSLQYRVLDGDCSQSAAVNHIVSCPTGPIPPKRAASIVIAVVFSPETSRNDPGRSIHDVLKAGAFQVVAELSRADGGDKAAVTTKIVKK